MLICTPLPWVRSLDTALERFRLPVDWRELKTVGQMALRRKQSLVNIAAGGERAVPEYRPGYRWVVLLILLASFAMSYMDRFGWAAVVPVAVPSLGWKMTQAGALVSGFYGGYVLAQIPGGALADKISIRWLLSASLALLGLFTLLTPSVPSFGGMMFFRVLAGFAAGPIFACAVKYQLNWFARGERATAMAIFTQGASLGTLLAYTIIPSLAMSGVWAYAFLVPGALTLLVALLVLVATREAPGFCPSAAPQLQSGAPSGVPSTTAFSLASFVLVCVAGFLRIGPAMGFVTWTVAYLVQGRGFGPVAAGALMGTYSLTSVLGGLVSGQISDRVAGRRRKPVAVAGLLLSASAICMLGFNSRPALFIWIIVLSGLAHGAVSPPLNTLASELAATRQVGKLMGIYNGAGQAGAMVFPVVLGWILDSTGNYPLLYTTMAVSRLLACAAVWLIREVRN